MPTFRARILNERPGNFIRHHTLSIGTNDELADLQALGWELEQALFVTKYRLEGVYH